VLQLCAAMDQNLRFEGTEQGGPPAVQQFEKRLSTLGSQLEGVRSALEYIQVHCQGASSPAPC
jgi:hypothetical protein